MRKTGRGDAESLWRLISFSGKSPSLWPAVTAPAASKGRHQSVRVGKWALHTPLKTVGGNTDGDGPLGIVLRPPTKCRQRCSGTTPVSGRIALESISKAAADLRATRATPVLSSARTTPLSQP